MTPPRGTPSERLRALRSDGFLDLPYPGSGSTRARWSALSALTRDNVVVGRLAEAHADADAILVESGGPAVGPRDIWGVWAAEPPHPQVTAQQVGGAWTLSGRKLWCSGAHLCTHALVTARVDGVPELFAVQLDRPGVQPVPDSWRAVGMADSDSGAVDFTDAAAVRVGESGFYLARPGFWHGAIGVAACWLGGAHAVADALYLRCARGDAGPHALAHLGGVDAALFAADSALDVAAAQIDADPSDLDGEARIRALRLRAVVERTVTETIDRVGRALGAAPLCLDHEHAQRVADLTTYVRQSHAEKDLEQLGRVAAGSAR